MTKDGQFCHSTFSFLFQDSRCQNKTVVVKYFTMVGFYHGVVDGQDDKSRWNVEQKEA